MKTLGLLLLLAASLTVAAQTAAPQPPAPQLAKGVCTDVLRQQIEADDAATLQLKSGAFTDGLEQGIAYGAGAALLVAGLAFRYRKPQPGDPSGQKSRSRAANA